MQEKKEHNKLVRDYIPAMLIKKNIFCETKTLAEEDMLEALGQKLVEELDELARALDSTVEKNILEEIGDVLTVTRELKLRVLSQWQVEELKNNDSEKSQSCQRMITYAHMIEQSMIEQASSLGCSAERLEEIIGAKQMVNGGFKDNMFLIYTIEEIKDPGQ